MYSPTVTGKLAFKRQRIIEAEIYCALGNSESYLMRGDSFET